jgi:two-component system CheB/CheR fusion protein
LANHVRSREAAFDLAPIPQIVIDRTKHLILANERARALCNIAPADVGRPFQDLEVSYKPIDLRTPLDDVLGRRRSLSLGDVTFTTSAGETSDLAVELSPLFDPSGSLLGVGIAFMDVTQRRRLQVELEHSNQELETALEELQSTNEELETTNEELQSTNEELETTNEELQSTNEELETMNEELQATNEELQTVNTEARETTSELDRLNTFFGSILMSLNAGIAVLDQDSNILVWNRRAEDLWGLREGEVVGQPFFDLDIGLPQGDLSKAVADVLEGGAPQVKTLDAVNRRGRSIKCRVEITRLEEAGPGNGGVIVLMEPRE